MHEFENPVRAKVGIAIGLVFVIFVIVVNTIAARRDIEMKQTMRRTSAMVRELEQIHTRAGECPISDDTPVDKVLSTHPRDGWGRSFRYISSGESYVLWSLGENGKPDRLPGGGEFEDRRIDLIVYTGVPWQGPAGFL